MNTIAADSQNQADNKKTMLWLFALVFGMFAFAFAQVQLYGLFCQAIGVNSLSRVSIAEIDKAKLLSQNLNSDQLNGAEDTDIDVTRLITIRFDATVNEGLPWSFKPLDKKIIIHPGEYKTVKYRVKNLTNEVIVGQSIASVSPWQAEPFLNKLQCFCHTKQTLQPGEEKEMPLLFTLSHDLPKGMNTLVLSYTFLNAEKQSAKKYQKNKITQN